MVTKRKDVRKVNLSQEEIDKENAKRATRPSDPGYKRRAGALGASKIKLIKQNIERSLGVGSSSTSKRRSIKGDNDEQEETRVFNEAASRRLRGILIGCLAALVAVVVLIGVLGTTNLFAIDTLLVKGANHLTEIEMVELADIPEGATLFNIDTELVRSRLVKDTWIQDAKVSRVYPNKLYIEVTEREIKAVCEIPSQNGRVTRDWAISADGLWIMPIPDKDSEAAALVNPQIYEDAENVLHIVDIPYGTTPEINTYSTDEYVNNALSIIANLTTSLSDRVVTVKANETASTTLILDNGIEIAFGAAEDIRDKERICLALLEQYPNQIAYINCSVVDEVTWRSI